MKEIKTQNEISELVHKFYAVVRRDQSIGPFFEKVIDREDLWNHHHEKIIDFWEVNLLGKGKFEGNPISLHLWVDMQNGYRLEKKHFERWLELWHQTIDANFYGTVASFAKERANAIADRIHGKVSSCKP